MGCPSVEWTFGALYLRCSVLDLFPATEGAVGVMCWHTYDTNKLPGSGTLEPEPNC